ncbi:MAG: PHP domain-containing protein, partial [Hydrogenophaga sp.]
MEQQETGSGTGTKGSDNTCRRPGTANIPHPDTQRWHHRVMFVHLRLHTEFSVVDGTTRIDDVVDAAAADGQPALAVTDLHNLFG